MIASEKAVIYARLSREDEDKIDKSNQSKSIVNQIAVLEDFAKAHGFGECEIYSDDGYSGGDFDRPAFSALIRDMRAKKFGILLIKDLSRLGRSLRKVGELIENVFPQNGVRVISLSDNYDSLFYKDEISVVLRSFLNEYYLKEFKKKCKNARERCARTKHLNFYPKYGYRFDKDGKEQIDENSASVVKRIFSCVANGFSCVKVAKMLNSEGVLTRSAYAKDVLNLKLLTKPSRLWSADKVWSIIKDYEYCGHSLNWVRHKKEERILLKNTHLAIISEELYEKARKNVEERAQTKRKLSHIGAKIVDANTAKNLLFSKKQQVYYLRKNGKTVYSVSKTIEDVLFAECVAMLEIYLREWAQKENARVIKQSQTQIADLNRQYARLIELKFENKIDALFFQKRQAVLLSSVKTAEESVRAQLDFSKYDYLLSKLKNVKTQKTELINLAMKVCYITKNSQSLSLKIVLHNFS